MSGTHEPRPEFVSHLEWQLRTSLKRETRFSRPTKPTIGGKVNIAVLVLASALMGAGGVVVKDEVQEQRVQEVLLAKLESQLKIAGLQLEMVRAQQEEAEGLYERGLVGEEALLAARLQAREAELEYMRLTLDQEEIRLSGKEPRNDVSAPLVDGRDFVTERLVALESIHREQVSLVEGRIARLVELVEMGTVGSERLAQENFALFEARSGLDGIRGQMGIRQRFLEGGMTEGEAEREQELSRAMSEANLVRAALDEAMGRLVEAERRVATGMLGEAELRRARLEVMELETQLEFLQIKLLSLRGGGVSPDG